ncbi:hypothetical protein ACFFX0_05575 [Citricoccus parietis]|uniref:Uncharacterized protein n=1 Tax=Citricoccus parietis TaxID=592307 RepID=A0ABV5FVJ9_9MICC
MARRTQRARRRVRSPARLRARLLAPEPLGRTARTPPRGPRRRSAGWTADRRILDWWSPLELSAGALHRRAAAGNSGYGHVQRTGWT